MRESMVGRTYVLGDGRRLEALDDFEILASAKRAFIEQARRDEHLRLRLDRERQLTPMPNTKPLQTTLF